MNAKALSIIDRSIRNKIISRLLIAAGLDFHISKVLNGWSKKSIDPAISLQQNMGFSESPQISEAIDRIHRRIQSIYVQHCPGGLVLDIGCGAGLYLQDFPQQEKLHGVDMSSDFLNEAKRRLPLANFYHADYFDTVLQEKMNIIYSISVLQYIPTTRIERLAKKLFTDISSNGILMLHYPLAHSEAEAFDSNITYVLHSPKSLESKFAKYFNIMSHEHAYDGRKLDFDFDELKYDADMPRSVRNCGLLICQRRDFSA